MPGRRRHHLAALSFSTDSTLKGVVCDDGGALALEIKSNVICSTVLPRSLGGSNRHPPWCVELAGSCGYRDDVAAICAELLS